MGRLGKASKAQERILAGFLVTHFPYGELTEEVFDYLNRNRGEITQMLLSAFQRIQSERCSEKVATLEHIIDCDSPPFVPRNWKVVEHRLGAQLEWDKKKVFLYFSEKQKNKRTIDGFDLRRELKNKPVLNANVLDYLYANPDLIPEEWKNATVFFWGTIYCPAVGHLSVRCLCWNGDEWVCSSYWLSNDWDCATPTAMLASVQS